MTTGKKRRTERKEEKFRKIKKFLEQFEKDCLKK